MGLGLGMKIDEHGNAVPGSGSMSGAGLATANYGGMEPNY
jgi:hypothetical protein